MLIRLCCLLSLIIYSQITFANTNPSPDSTIDPILVHDFTKLDWLYSHVPGNINKDINLSSDNPKQTIVVPGNLITQPESFSWTTVTGWYELNFSAEDYWSRDNLVLLIGIFGELDETYLNDQLIGKTGQFAEDNHGYVEYLMGTRVYKIPAGLLQPQANILRIKQQSIVGTSGILQAPVGISSVSEAQQYKQQREHRVIVWQSFILGMIVFNLLIALILFLNKGERNLELLAFLSIYVLALTIAVVEHLVIFESGLKTVWIQQIGFVASMLIPIPILYYFRSVMNIHGGHFAPIIFSLYVLVALTGLFFFDLAIVLSYCYLLWFILTFFTISYASLLGIRAVREKKYHLLPLFIGIAFFWLSIFVLPILFSDTLYFARHDEIGHLFFIIGLTLSNIQRMIILKDSHKNLSKKVINAVEDERHHLARELHDGINQRLAAQRLHLQMHESQHPSKALSNLSDDMLETMEDMTRLVHHLRPLVLKNKGLIVAMQDYVGDLQQENPTIEITLQTHCETPEKVQAQHLFRIFQECLNNAIKYAEASQITVDLKQQSKQIILSINDNGKGIKAAKSQVQTVPQSHMKRGQGSINISERVDLMEGDLVRTSSANGTLIRVTIPFAVLL